MRALLLGLGVLAVLAGPHAHAGPGETLLRREMNAARSAAAESALADLAARRPRDQQAIYALGVAQLTNALETFGQGLYRLGYTGVNAGRFMQPMLTLPVPPNPDPAPADYAAIRTLLQRFVDDLDEARATLARVDDPRAKLHLDLARVRMDMNGDGAADMTLADVLAPPPAPGADREAPTARRPAQRPVQRPVRVPKQRNAQSAPSSQAPRTSFAFDRADALWLQGYAQLLAAPADFILAHDFSTLTEAAFHRLFRRAGMALLDAPDEREGAGFVNSEFADAIAAVHFVNWPVIEPERRARVRERLLAVSALSRANWAAIRAERDNDREWLPNPRQTSPFPGLTVTDERIDAWLAFLDTWDAALNGERLIPHWRFAQGMDMRRFFEGRENFDIVSILTGYGALPYLKEGETLSNEEIMMLREEMGPNALLFAAWFN